MYMSESSKIPVLVMLFFVMVVQILALAITPAISASGNRVFEDPTSIANPFAYMLLILLFTGLLLLAMRLKREWIISVFILLSIAVSIYYVMAAFMSPLLALVPTLAIMLLLHFYPEWYIIDAFGILVCAGISSLFGVSMTIPPALLLLVVLAVYDAISVYKTRHMISLAEGAIKIKAPLLFVVPKSRDYSFRIDQEISNSSEETKKRGAYFLGLGDAIIPTILVISASWSLPAGGFYGLSLPVLGAMLGTYLGFLLLMTTSRDRPQAGLPFLNSGVILGFLVGCLAAGVRPI
jgi:presenilin-like A22 family membrane protease